MGAQLPLVVLASLTNKRPMLVEGVLTGERREEKACGDATRRGRKTVGKIMFKIVISYFYVRIQRKKGFAATG